MMKPSKRARVTSRLTNLHETELSHILSRLPTNEAVRTSILSKDWRYKWTNSYVVDIVDRLNLNNDPQMFVDFMNTRLVSLKDIRKFRLACDSNHDSNLVQPWIDNALKHNLERLYLQLCDETGIILPCSVLNSTCLRKLKLDLFESTLNVAMNNFAPNLTRLNIYGVDIVNNQNTSTTLKFSFPVLKTFSAARHSWFNVTSVEIDAPLLTTFCSEPFCSDHPYLLVILSPRITEFACTIRLFEEIVVNGSSIVSAELSVAEGIKDYEFSDVGLRFRKMVNEFTNLRSLTLWGYLPEVSFVYQLPRHDILRKLGIFGSSNAELLLKLLHKTPSLEVLRFGVREWIDFDYGAVDSIPSCLVSHLEKVRISYFTCETPQYNMLNFLLKNGKKLKKLIMTHVPDEMRNEVEEYVSTFSISGPVLEFQDYGI